jgi:hypothetical protein
MQMFAITARSLPDRLGTRRARGTLLTKAVLALLVLALVAGALPGVGVGAKGKHGSSSRSPHTAQVRAEHGQPQKAHRGKGDQGNNHKSHAQANRNGKHGTKTNGGGKGKHRQGADHNGKKDRDGKGQHKNRHENRKNRKRNKDRKAENTQQEQALEAVDQAVAAPDATLDLGPIDTSAGASPDESASAGTDPAPDDAGDASDDGVTEKDGHVTLESLPLGQIPVPQIPNCCKPLAPTGLGATSITPTSLVLVWSDQATIATPSAPTLTPETGFEIYRATWTGATQGAWVKIKTLPAHNGTGSMNYADSGLTEGTKYSYRIRAINQYGGSDSSVHTTATTLVRPTNLAVTPVSATELRVSWTDASAAQTAAALERQADEGAWNTIKTYGALSGATTYTDTGLTAGTNYCYRVSISNTVSQTTSTTICAMTPLAAPKPPTLEAGATSLTVTWQDDVRNELQWIVSYYRKSGGSVSSWTSQFVPGRAGTGQESATVTGLHEGTDYCVKIEVRKGPDTSPASPVVCARTLTRPDLDVTYKPSSVTIHSSHSLSDTVSATFTICNLGTAHAESSQVNFEVHDYSVSVGQQREDIFWPEAEGIPQLAAGECWPVTVTFDRIGYKTSVTATVDPANDGNGANNWDSVVIDS